MKTVILDDDPTGTQSSQHVRVLLDTSAKLIEAELRTVDTLFLQTNSRAIDEASAVSLVRRIRDDTLRFARAQNYEVQFVLRGDSTLRGHVFAETEVFRGPDTLMVFVPAFPAGGRTTVDGVHLVHIHGHDVPAHETEYARDPVFGFSSGVLTDYVGQRSTDPVVAISLPTVRGDRHNLARVFAEAPRRAILVPDAQCDSDISAIAAAVATARQHGRDIVVRCAAPLAAALGGVTSTGLLPLPVLTMSQPTLLVCGSHTTGATRQLAAVSARFGHPVHVNTTEALLDPAAAGASAASELLEQLRTGGLAILSSERMRRDEHNSLDHGEKVMA
ncbi:MAG: four-carbon acid sugar kinase family protein, partial [Mycobacterium sp.]